MEQEGKKKRVFPFPRVKGRIVEELATQRILDGISEEGNLPIPPSWLRDVDRIVEEVFREIEIQAKQEGVKTD